MSDRGTTAKTQGGPTSKITEYTLFNLFALVACTASSQDHVFKPPASQTVIDNKIYAFNASIKLISSATYLHTSALSRFKETASNVKYIRPRLPARLSSFLQRFEDV